MYELFVKSIRSKGKTYLSISIIETLIGLVACYSATSNGFTFSSFISSFNIFSLGASLVIAAVFYAYLNTLYNCVIHFTNYNLTHSYKSFAKSGNPDDILKKADNDIKDSNYLYHYYNPETNDVFC